MGTIIKLPLVVISDKADETRSGICPQLNSSVRNTPDAVSTAVFSESAGRNALNSIQMELSAGQVGSGIPVLYEADVNSLKLFTISLTGELSGTVSGDEIQLTSLSDYAYSETVNVNDIVLNSGRLQEASEISYAGFTTGNMSQVLFYDVKSGDAVGKILIKCTEEFDDATTRFTIGTDFDSQGYATEFTAPTAVSTTSLVSFDYGQYMSEKCKWHTYDSENTVNVPGNVIKIFMTGGESNTKGKLNCVVFYDRILGRILFAGGINSNHDGLYGWYSNTISVVDTMTDTASMLGSNLRTQRASYTAGEKSEKAYFIGGQSQTGYTSDSLLSDIERLDKNVMTNNGISRTDLAVKKMFVSSVSNNYNDICYIAGGQPASSTYENTIEKFNMSTETMTTPFGTTLLLSTSDQAVVKDVDSQKYAWFAGGWNGSAHTDMIMRLDMTSDTTAMSDRANLMDAYAHMAPASTSSYGYFFGGWKNSTYHTDIIQKYNYSTDTSNATVTAYMAIGRYVHSSGTSAEKVYLYGGVQQSGSNYYDVNCLEVFNTNTDTINSTVRSVPETSRRNAEGVTI